MGAINCLQFLLLLIVAAALLSLSIDFDHGHSLQASVFQVVYAVVVKGALNPNFLNLSINREKTLL